MRELNIEEMTAVGGGYMGWAPREIIDPSARFRRALPETVEPSLGMTPMGSPVLINVQSPAALGLIKSDFPAWSQATPTRIDVPHLRNGRARPTFELP